MCRKARTTKRAPRPTPPPNKPIPRGSSMKPRQIQPARISRVRINAQASPRRSTSPNRHRPQSRGGHHHQGAPFSGYISSRPVAVGQYVALTAKIATLVRVTPLKLELQVQESNAPQLKIGDDVEASVPGYPGRTVPRQCDGHQPDCGCELPHRGGGSEISPIRTWRSSPACSPRPAFF